MKTIGRVLLLGLGLACAGCGSTSPRSTGAAIAPTRPLAMPLTVVSSEGTVEARSARNTVFFPLEKGKSAADIVGVQTHGGGAVLELGDAASFGGRGRLWIKDGTSIDLGQDADGQVRVLVTKGEARLREGTRDVIFHPVAGKTEALETSRHLSDADWSLALETKREPAGFGSLETRGSNGEKGRLAIESVHVRAKRVGDFADTEVEHVFKNDSEQNLEGTFRFPLPDGAILIGFAMEVNDQLMEGELVEAEKARKTFESIVDSMRIRGSSSGSKATSSSSACSPSRLTRTRRSSCASPRRFTTTPTGGSSCTPLRRRRCSRKSAVFS